MTPNSARLWWLLDSCMTHVWRSLWFSSFFYLFFYTYKEIFSKATCSSTKKIGSLYNQAAVIIILLISSFVEVRINIYRNEYLSQWTFIVLCVLTCVPRSAKSKCWSKSQKITNSLAVCNQRLLYIYAPFPPSPRPAKTKQTPWGV